MNWGAAIVAVLALVLALLVFAYVRYILLRLERLLDDANRLLEMTLDTRPALPPVPAHVENVRALHPMRPWEDAN